MALQLLVALSPAKVHAFEEKIKIFRADAGFSRNPLKGGAYCETPAVEGAASTAGPAGKTAINAWKASTSPAPNRGSIPGAPRSRAVLMSARRTASGVRPGLRSSISAITPVISAAENDVPEVIRQSPPSVGSNRFTPGAAIAT